MSQSQLIRENILLAPLTTLKIGGAARFFVEARTEAEIVFAAGFAAENKLPLFILGGGSNVLIADEGFKGLVLRVALKGIEAAGDSVTAAAGEDWDEFVRFCVERDLAGIECLSGIPGSVGGTPVQNVGAYGQEVSETIESVRAFDRRTKEFLELTNADCKFAYRASIFNTTDKNRFVVSAVTYRLKKSGAPKIVYRDLAEFFSGKTSSLSETRRAVIKIRAEKSMVASDSDPNSQSAGSFFKNPVISKTEYEKIARAAQILGGGNVPSFVVDEQHLKIPAAWLIEKSGFYKGFKLGNAGLSTRHTLAIVNLGNATAMDILKLKDLIQAKVFEKFSVELKPEPIFVGGE